MWNSVHMLLWLTGIKSGIQTINRYEQILPFHMEFFVFEVSE